MTLIRRQGSIETRIKNLAQEATNLKTSQAIGWDSIKCYKTETTKDYDVSLDLDSGTFNGGVAVLVKFTADHQDAPFAKCMLDITVDNTRKYRIGADMESRLFDDFVASNGSVRDTFGSYSPTHTQNKANEVSWYDSITVEGAHNIKIKVRVYATDTGKLIAGYETSPLQTVLFI